MNQNVFYLTIPLIHRKEGGIMKSKCIIVLLIMFAGLTINLNAEDEVKWIRDYETALNLSSETGRNVLVILTAPDWCYWCIVLETETLSDQKVKRFINTNFVPLLILETVNGRANSQLDHFNIQGYPTILVINENGSILAELGGYVDAKNLIESATPYIE